MTAEMDLEHRWIDVIDEARKERLLSGFKIPGQAILGFGRRGKSISYTIYKCSMSGCAGCLCRSFSAASGIKSSIPAKSWVPNNTRASKWMTPSARKS
jgi:hypothetical protein